MVNRTRIFDGDTGTTIVVVVVVVILIDVVRSTFAPFPFPATFHAFFPADAGSADASRKESSCLKARRRPSCLHLNCFGLNRGCERLPLRPPFLLERVSLVRDLARKAGG